MSKLDPKVLEAARKTFSAFAKGSLCEHSPSRERRAFDAAVQAAIDAADLVPRSELEKLEAETADLRFRSGCLHERMETLREAATNSVGAMVRREKAEAERDEARAQVAALREALDKTRGALDRALMCLKEVAEDGGTIYDETMEIGHAVLTDTAKAASQYQRVPRGWAVMQIPVMEDAPVDKAAAEEQVRDYDETQSAFSVVREHLALKPDPEDG